MSDQDGQSPKGGTPRKPLFAARDDAQQSGAQPRAPRKSLFQQPAERQQQQQGATGKKPLFQQPAEPPPRKPAPPPRRAAPPPPPPSPSPTDQTTRPRTKKPLFTIAPDAPPPSAAPRTPRRRAPDDDDGDITGESYAVCPMPYRRDDTATARRQAEYYHAVRALKTQPRALLSAPIPQARALSRRHPIATALLIAALSVAVLFLFWPQDGHPTVSRWLGPLAQPLANALDIANPFMPAPPLAIGNYQLQGGSSLSAQQVDSILESYGSPAAGTGETWVALGRRYNIDPAYPLAFFVHESTAGTHPNWAGQKSDGTTTHNIGNIICAGYPTCYGRFRDYGSWEEGIEDWYRLIDDEYIEGRGMTTLDEVIPVYAPSIENDVNGYTNVVKQLVDSWRISSMQGRGMIGNDRPQGNPLKVANTVMTQGYGTGTHAPANVWGAIDLAVDGDNDGEADPEGTQGQPVYATHSGIVKTSRNTWPAGNHLWVINQHYKTGYAHLEDFAVANGQMVQPGDLIGHVGSTGQSSGPHLDYQVWQKQGDQWVNQNPMHFGVLVQ